mmetsp:Transcript_56966/g.124950  ORF Transcript_56966/g.124950 Transcript_56966/m.124950 type:complete len:207 (-) Transcript_56966:85-705(-)
MSPFPCCGWSHSTPGPASDETRPSSCDPSWTLCRSATPCGNGVSPQSTMDAVGDATSSILSVSKAPSLRSPFSWSADHTWPWSITTPVAALRETGACGAAQLTSGPSGSVLSVSGPGPATRSPSLNVAGLSSGTLGTRDVDGCSGGLRHVMRCGLVRRRVAARTSRWICSGTRALSCRSSDWFDDWRVSARCVVALALENVSLRVR